MPVRFKRSYRDRKQAVAKRKKVILKTIIIIFTFQILFTVFFSTIKIDTISMEPGLEKGSVMIYSPLVYGFNIEMLNIRMPQLQSPERGDLVVLTPPYISNKKGFVSFISPLFKFLSLGKINLQSLGTGKWKQQTLIKRVIAVPGDTLKIQNFKVFIKPSGSDYFLSEFEVLDSSYDIVIEDLPAGWDQALPLSGTMKDVTLENDQYFVLGDNRTQSSDSTSWGVLDRNKIKGRVLMTYWPLNKIKFY